jgi:CBS-domain-containing membrane protein
MAGARIGDKIVRARDVMTLEVVTVHSSMSVEQAALLMDEQGISGMPVVDEVGSVVGMITDGDIARRSEATLRQLPWWSATPLPLADAALDFVRRHRRKVGSVMTKSVIAVDADTPVAHIAGLFEEFGIKRVPVTADERVVGIVGRADLMRALVVAGTSDLGQDDQAIRAALLVRLRDDAGVREPRFNLLVENGIVHLWGVLPTEAERHAVKVLAEDTLGVRRVDDHTRVADTRLALNTRIA